MGGGESRTVTQQELSPEQRALIAPVIPIAKQYLAKPPTLFPGTGISGFNPLQQQAQQMTINAAQGMLPTTQQIPQQFQQLMGNIPSQARATQTGMVDQSRGIQQQVNRMIGNVAGGTNFLTSGAVLRPESNPALQGAIEAASRPAIQTFREQVLPGITQESMGAGGFGGTRQGIAEGIAGRGLGQTVGDIGARMASENYQSGLQAMLGGLQAAGQQRQDVLGGGQLNLAAQQGGGQLNLAAQQAASQLLGQGGNILGQTLLPAQLTEAVGGQQRALEQARLSEQVQRFTSQQMIPFAAAQDVAAMAFGMPGGTTTTTGRQPGNPMAGAQLGMGALSILPMLMGKSDRRLKENVRFVGSLLDGLRVYVYRFIGSVVDTIGLMAEEVAKLYPEAVVVGSDGYKRVKYLEIPTWMESVKRSGVR